MDFQSKLLNASRRNSSLLCVGLDPDLKLIPVKDVFDFNKEIVDATRDLVCAYKPNLGFYEAMGIDGIRAMKRTVAHIGTSIPIIGDGKRGDIASTAAAYASSLFGIYGFDAATVSPYLGYDSLVPFLDYSDKGVFILCRTSNAGASDFQDLICGKPGTDGLRLFEVVALRAREWNVKGNVGLVVGATHPEELSKVRRLCPDMPLLIPGIGAQGGDLAATVKYGVDARGEKAIVSSSRQVLYASRGKDFAAAARREATKLRDQINQYLAAGQ